MNCFEPLTQGSVCAKCGFDNDSECDMLYLPRKTVLAGKYVVGKALSQESDAVTYSGYDIKQRKAVIIREFMPKGIANRLEGNLDVHIRERYKKSFQGYKASFLKLWSTLKGMNSLSAVIPVYDVFEENETAYSISEKMATVSLRDFLLRNNDNNILWEKARLMFMPVLTTLENLHSNGIIHGAISPDALVLCKDGKVRLAGFCISECCCAGGELEFNANEGYTALEQYDNNHKVCPATDIYAFSACIYRALVGTNPPSAVEREINDKLMIPNRIAEKIPAHVIKALGAGLQIYPEKRIQNVYDYRELLNAAPSVVAQSSVEEAVKDPGIQDKPVERTPARQKNDKKDDGKKKAIIAIVAVILVVVIGAAVYFFGFSDAFKPEETTESTTLASVTVPDFCSAGYTETDVKNSGTWNKQFKITFNYEYSKEKEAGIVFKQSVAAGETVNEGSEIVLTVSKGIETASVPNVNGLNQDEAVKQLEAAGFAVKILTVYNNGDYKEGYVKQSNGIAPQENTELAKGEEVIIQVYGAPETTTTQASTEAQ